MTDGNPKARGQQVGLGRGHVDGDEEAVFEACFQGTFDKSYL